MSLDLVVEYVTARQNEDGGFLFARQAGYSTVEDTFFAVSVLKTLGREVPRKRDVVAFLASSQQEDGSFSSVQVARYAVEGLSLLGEHFTAGTGFRSWLLSFEKKGFWLGLKNDLSLEPFEGATALLSDTGLISEVDAEDLRRQLMSYEGPDGGFGMQHETLTNTYLAIRSLKNMGFEVRGMARDFLSACEVPRMGFSEVPNSFPPTLYDVFHGVWTASQTGYDIKEREEVRKFIMGFQNGNGGFRHFPEMGISTLEDTFYAISSYAILGPVPIRASAVQRGPTGNGDQRKKAEGKPRLNRQVKLPALLDGSRGQILEAGHLNWDGHPEEGAGHDRLAYVEAGYFFLLIR